MGAKNHFTCCSSIWLSLRHHLPAGVASQGKDVEKGKVEMTQNLLATVGTRIWPGTCICGQVCGKPILLMNTKWCLLMNTGLPVDYIFRATCRDTKSSQFLPLLLRRVVDIQPLSKPHQTVLRGLEPAHTGSKPLQGPANQPKDKP